MGRKKLETGYEEFTKADFRRECKRLEELEQSFTLSRDERFSLMEMLYDLGLKTKDYKEAPRMLRELIHKVDILCQGLEVESLHEALMKHGRKQDRELDSQDFWNLQECARERRDRIAEELYLRKSRAYLKRKLGMYLS